MHHQDKATTNKNKGEMLALNTTWERMNNAQDANKHPYNPNYKGNNPMTRTQWHKYQRQKKLSREMHGYGDNQVPKANG